MVIKLSVVKPRSCGETITNPYACQNILEDQVNFPEKVEDMEEIISAYSDRMVQWDREKYKKLRKEHFGNTSDQWHNLDREKTKRFLEDYFGKPVTGFRIIRDTNLANGYPVWRIELYSKKPESLEQTLYTGQTGPLVRPSAELS